MAKAIPGLSDHEQGVLDKLDGQIREKAVRNDLRTAYMEGKKVLHRLPPTMPGYVRQMGLVLGWPAKAVEMLHRRITFEGFYSPDGDLEAAGLDELIDANRYGEELSMGELDALIYGPAFEIVTKGSVDEPPAVISQASARNATGTWNPRSRVLDDFLSVIRRNERDEIQDANLYLPGSTVVIVDGRVVDRQSHRQHVPVELVPYRPRLGAPFGASRISREVMSLTNSAIRTAMRSEVTGDIYGVPGMVLFGPGEEAFKKNGIDLLLDSIVTVPDNPDIDEVSLRRASVQQLQQGNQTPHMEQLQVWAGLFAGETNIPVSSLGVGLSQANPTSEGSYVASREDLIAEAEAASRIWARAHERTARRAWMIATGETSVPDDLVSMRARYRDPRYLSQSERADSAVKFVSAIPGLAQSETFLRTLGWDDATTEGIIADLQRAEGRATIESLIRQAPAPVADEGGEEVEATDDDNAADA